jgi:hypothetical protein
MAAAGSCEHGKARKLAYEIGDTTKSMNRPEWRRLGLVLVAAMLTRATAASRGRDGSGGVWELGLYSSVVL